MKSRCVRIPNRTENTEAATESAREYRNGHRIGSRIPNRPSISVFKCENTESDGPNSQVISLVNIVLHGISLRVKMY